MIRLGNNGTRFIFFSWSPCLFVAWHGFVSQSSCRSPSGYGWLSALLMCLDLLSSSSVDRAGTSLSKDMEVSVVIARQQMMIEDGVAHYGSGSLNLELVTFRFSI